MSYQDNYRDWEITADGKLWPCCKFVIDIYPWDPSEDKITLQDKKIMQEITNNPNWNNLFENSFEDIANHPLYKDYISLKGWDSDNPPLPCAIYCGKVTSNKHKNHQDKFIR